MGIERIIPQPKESEITGEPEEPEVIVPWEKDMKQKVERSPLIRSLEDVLEEKEKEEQEEREFEEKIKSVLKKHRLLGSGEIVIELEDGTKIDVSAEGKIQIRVSDDNGVEVVDPDYKLSQLADKSVKVVFKK